MDSFDNDKPKPRRWVDIPSDSDDDLSLMRNPRFSTPAPIVDPDDSYNGPPVASCCDSNKGLNEMLKKKCTAADDEDANMCPKTEHGDKAITPDGTDSKSSPSLCRPVHEWMPSVDALLSFFGLSIVPRTAPEKAGGKKK